MKFKGITDDTDGRRGEKRTGSKKHIMKGKDAPPKKYHKTP